MTLHYEIVEKRFMPAFKAQAASLMSSKYDLTQVKIANILGVTQAAVSKYLTKGNASKTEILLDDEKMRHFIESITKGNEHEAQRTVCKMCQDNVKFNCGLMVK